MSSFTEQSEKFLSWLSSSENTIISGKIGINDYREQGQGRGLIALKDISEGELLFAIPKSLLLTVENSELSKHLPQVKELSPWLGEILTLMFEYQRTDSRWRCYLGNWSASHLLMLDILTDTFDTPMFWTDDELEYLQGTNVPPKIGKEDAECSYKDVLLPIIKSYPELFDPLKCALSDFHRCGSLILACSFDLECQSQYDENQPQKAMVPLADMLNSNTKLNNARLFYEELNLEMKAFKPIFKGQQIFNTYGNLPNSDLLRKYGYVEDNNIYNVVEISGDSIVDLCGEVDLKQDKIEYLLDRGILDDSIEIDVNGVPDELVIIMSTLLLSESEFLRHLKAGTVPKGKKDEEMKIFVKNLLEKRLGLYNTTRDEELIANDKEMTCRKRMAIIVRLGEIKLLKDAIHQVSSWTDSCPPLKKLRFN